MFKCPALPWYEKIFSKKAECWFKLRGTKFNGKTFIFDERYIFDLLNSVYPDANFIIYSNRDQNELYFGCDFSFYDNLWDSKLFLQKKLGIEEIIVNLLFQKRPQCAIL